MQREWDVNRNGDRATISFHQLLEHLESVAGNEGSNGHVVRVDVTGGFEVEGYDACRVNSLRECLRQERLFADSESISRQYPAGWIPSARQVEES